MPRTLSISKQCIVLQLERLSWLQKSSSMGRKRHMEPLGMRKDSWIIQLPCTNRPEDQIILAPIAKKSILSLGLCFVVWLALEGILAFMNANYGITRGMAASKIAGMAQRYSHGRCCPGESTSFAFCTGPISAEGVVGYNRCQLPPSCPLHVGYEAHPS